AGRQDAGHREPDEDVRALEGPAETTRDPTRVGGGGDPALHEVHAFSPTAVDDAVLVDPDDVTDPGRLKNLDGGGPGRADPCHDHPDPPRVLAHDLERVEERGEHHDRGAVLIVVEDRDVQLLAQALLDVEAARRGDVLEVDAAEGRRDELHRLHDLVHVLGRQTHGEGVDPRELLEQHRLAFHHRQRRLGTDVAQAQHGRAVGHDRDGVVLDRQRERPLAVVPDRQADPRHARGVGHREVVAGPEWDLVADFDLSTEVHEERPVGDRADAYVGQPAEPAHDLLGVDAVARLDGDVALGPLPRGLDQVDSANVAPGVSDRSGDATEHTRQARDLESDGEAVAGTRGNHAVDSTAPRPIRGFGAPQTVSTCSSPFVWNFGWGERVVGRYRGSMNRPTVAGVRELPAAAERA